MDWRRDALASGYTHAVLREAIRRELRKLSPMKGSLMKISCEVRRVLSKRLQKPFNIAQVYLLCTDAIKMSSDMYGTGGSSLTPNGVAFKKWSRDHVECVIASSDSCAKNRLYHDIVEIIDEMMAACEETTIKLGNVFVLEIRRRMRVTTTHVADFYLYHYNGGVVRSRKALENHIVHNKKWK